MNNEKSKESRRKLLKSITAGSGAVIFGKSLPNHWTKPVVNSVILPTHAQTTCPVCQGTYCYSFTPQAPVFMEINVNNQAISISLNTPGGTATGTGTAVCGSFTISATGGQNPSLVVNGTIAIDCTQVTGTLTIDGSDQFSFTANAANCG